MTLGDGHYRQLSGARTARIGRAVWLPVSAVKALNWLSVASLFVPALAYLTLAGTLRAVGFRQAAEHLTKWMCLLWYGVFGVRRRVWAHRDAPLDEPCVIMAEHFSRIDPPLYISSAPVGTRALVAEEEYRRMPLFGWLLRAAGMEFVARRNTERAIGQLRDLAARMQAENFSVLLVPAGTRAITAELPPFKPGVFHLAVQLRKPVVPLYLIGVETLRIGKVYCRPGWVDVVFGEPISPDRQPDAFASPETLMAIVRERMVEEGARLRRERESLPSSK